MTTATTSETSSDPISILNTLKDWPHGRRPLTSLPEQAPMMDSSSQTDTNIEDLFDTDNTIQHVCETPSGKASPQWCPVCRVGLALRTKLAAHLKLYHPDSKNYQCMDCDSAFNTANDLMCHCSNQHSVKKLKCKSCDYWAVTKVWMKLHVCKPTSGLQCDKCGKRYPNQ